MIPAPADDRIADHRSITAVIDGVSASAAGAIGVIAIGRGRRATIELPAIAIAVATLLALVTLNEIPEPPVLVAVGLVGLALASRSARRS